MDNIYDVAIIGAGTAGLTASIYAARAGKKTIIFEYESIGGQISYSPKVENYPGFVEISGMEFSDKLFEQSSLLGVEFEPEYVNKIEAGKPYKRLFTQSRMIDCKSVIIAAGVKHKKLGIDDEQKYTGKGVSYCAICDGSFYKGKTVAVIGGGSSALQSAELLSDICSKVYLVHRREGFRAEEHLINRVKSKKNIEFLLNYTVKSLNGDNVMSEAILASTSGGKELTIKIHGMFVSVGQVPQNDIFRDIVKLDESGYIIAGEDCLTSCEGIFAAGDCRTKQVRQLTTASADGSVSALAACNYVNQLED